MSTKNNVGKFCLKEVLPAKTLLRLIGVWAIVAVFAGWGSLFLNESMSYATAAISFAILLFTIIAASFGVVREADKLAHQLGEPYGTLILTLSVVSIEVILISAMMLGPGEFPTIGKDSIFSVMMIIMNLVMGLCMLLGGLKYGEQEYNTQGALSYLAMIVLLGGISMVLPEFITGSGGGMFHPIQAIFLSSVVIVLYAFFLYYQTGKYSYMYVQPAAGEMKIRYIKEEAAKAGEQKKGDKDGKTEVVIRSLILFGMLLPIVLLSHDMAIVVDFGIAENGLPQVLGGLIIAIIVFTPESITSIKAALNNEFQRSVNLCQGAFVSTVGLTIPAVLIVGLIANKIVLLGLTATETVLFMITLLLSLMNFNGQRTTPIQGLMHLVVFAVFVLLIFCP